MSALGYIVTAVCAYFLFTLPRKWAPLPMLIAAVYMTVGQQIDVAGLHFTVIRIIALVGWIRVSVKRERMAGGWQPIDKFMAAWGIWSICSSIFHDPLGSTIVFRCGYMFDNVVVYFLFRIFMRNFDEFLQLCKILIIVLVPLAVLMLAEKFTSHNWFAFLGGVPDEVIIRNGKVRAQGPFAHPILAGTAGAACLPMALFFWQTDKKLAITGLVASLAIVYASASSGPIMTVLTIMLGMGLWKVRAYLSQIRWAALAGLLVLNMIMKAPVYYLLARIDLTGGSTGWHRAALIEASIDHFGEWWLGGTDHTRHWMPTGAPWNINHTDITNHYIQIGVLGGVPLLLLFLGALISAYGAIGRALRRYRRGPVSRQFLIWTLGAILFGHMTTFFSVTYFDQSIIFLYLLLATIASLHVAKKFSVPVPAKVETPPEAAATTSATPASA